MLQHLISESSSELSERNPHPSFRLTLKIGDSSYNYELADYGCTVEQAESASLPSPPFIIVAGIPNFRGKYKGRVGVPF